MHQQIEGIALAGEQILDAAQDQRAAMSRLRGLDLIQCQPAGADDAFVEFAVGFPAAQLTGKGEDRLLFAVNKWLIAHKESGLEKDGAWIGLTGKNVSL